MMLAIPYLLLTACGSGVSGGSSTSPLASSKGCVVSSCHGTMPSVVTGRPIGDEWRASSHYFLNVAGCATCHKHTHQNSCANCHGGGVPSGPMAANDPSAECSNCHVSGPNLIQGLDGRHLPLLNSNFGAGSSYSLTQGWRTNASAATTTAGWMILQGSDFQSQCIWCHNPHDNRVLPQHKDWAESGHGATTAAYLGTDFKRRGSPSDYRTQVAGDSCVRCHTATGFINWVGSGMQDVSAWGSSTRLRFGSSTTAMTKQTLYCYVCHDNGKGKAYAFGRDNQRSIPAQGANNGIRVWFNYSTTTPTAVTGANANGTVTFVPMKVTNFSVDFPYIGISDRCLLCHSGRATGSLIKEIATKVNANGETVTFQKLSRIGTHDFAGGGTMFRALGFEFYPSSSYAQPGSRPYLHDQLGMGDKRGPCVACHMSSAETHSLEAVAFSNRTSAALSALANNFPISSISTALCSTCHASGGVGNPFFNGTVAALNAKKTGYGLTVNAVNAWLVAKALVWARTAGGVTSATNTSNWVSQPDAALSTNYASQSACVPPGSTAADFMDIGTRNMGAALNYDFAKNEPGAFVHNDLYIKRILYDTIDWLDDCTMNNSTPAALDFTSNELATNTMMTLPTLTPPRQTDFRLAPAEITAVKGFVLDPVTGLRPGGN